MLRLLAVLIVILSADASAQGQVTLAQKLGVSDPSAELYRLDSKLSRWGGEGFEDVSISEAVALGKERSRLCGKTDCSKRWDWLRFVCNKISDQDSGLRAALLEEVTSFINNPSQLPNFESFNSDSSSTCAQDFFGPLLQRTPENSPLMTAILVRIVQFFGSQKIGPRTLIDLYERESRPIVRRMIVEKIVGPYFQINHSAENMAKMPELGVLSVLQARRPDLYSAYFEKHQTEILKKGLDKSKFELEIYCLAGYFLNKNGNCLNFIRKMGGDSTAAPAWLKFLAFKAKLSMGALDEAKGILSQLAPELSNGCTNASADKFWLIYFAGQIFRGLGDFRRSAECLDKIANADAGEGESFLARVEAMKSGRKNSSFKESQARLDSLRRKMPKNLGPDSVFGLILDLEELKNFALAGMTQQFETLKSKVNAQLYGSPLEVYRTLPKQIEMELLNGLKAATAVSTFESKDVSTLIPLRQEWRSTSR